VKAAQRRPAKGEKKKKKGRKNVRWIFSVTFVTGARNVAKQEEKRGNSIFLLEV